MRYALRHWDGLILYLNDGRLEMDTNVPRYREAAQNSLKWIAEERPDLKAQIVESMIGGATAAGAKIAHNP